MNVGTDGKVRAADVEYKIKISPIHKLRLVVPVEEQTMEETKEQDG
jgi:hypothetical protein